MHREGVVMFDSPTDAKVGGGVGVSDASLEARRCAAAIGMLAAQHADFGARNSPALVIVPALAMAGWAAEFARWAPELNVVEYCGSAVSRHVVQEYEWSHRRAAKEAGGITSVTFHPSSLSPSRCNVIAAAFTRHYFKPLSQSSLSNRKPMSDGV